ncbi:MAG: hypothetical protein ABTD50_20660 [Polyangiaceae bacterium]|jgi:hypothetical protein
MEKRSRSPEEVLAALDDGDVADELDRVAAMSSADIDRELAASGADARAIGAGANEVFEHAMRRRAHRSSRDRKSESPRRGVRVWIGASAIAASIAIVAVAVTDPMRFGPWSSRWRTPLATPTAAADRAATLRGRASGACDKGLFAECEAALDLARAVDPGGENTDAVRALRHRIEAEDSGRFGVRGANAGDR